MSNIPIHFEQEWIGDLQRILNEDGPWNKWELFKLAVEAEQAMAVEQFDSLQCLKHLPHFEPLPHQIATAEKVLKEMRGRAILADEVGLGKTIEAGLVIKEYMVRGLVKKTLILVPSSLVLQWTRELQQKFGIPAMAQKKEYMWKQYDVLIASIDTAKREPHRSLIMEQQYDMLVVDEAHKLKNKNTINYRFIKEIKKKYCLLLTATPIQNNMDELFNLITLLKPGHLGQAAQFQKNYVEGKRQSKNEHLLKKELGKVMIRHRRSEGNIHWTKRIVETVPLSLSPEEWQLYQGVTDYVTDQYRQAGNGQNAFALITLQREVCSSRDAAYVTLAKMYGKAAENSPIRPAIRELVELIKNIQTHTKAEKVVELIKGINDKVIVFTEYKATLRYLQQFLHQHGITSVGFEGGFKRNKKDWMRELFQDRAQVLVATEAGGEGINLQFCNHVINYDMPWNPMKVEQRIGRVHRLGQERDVYIYNLSTHNTIEQYILNLLYEKIDLFEMVIGELDTIIERLSLSQSIEHNIVDILLGSDSRREMEIKLENMGEVIRSLRQDLKSDVGSQKSEVGN